MSMATGKSQQKIGPKKPLSQEQIVAGFQELRQQQRAMANKISELDMERRDHDLVIEALKEVDPSRKCFRMVGGVLVERTVKEVLPALENNHAQISKLITSLTSQMEAKGKEVNSYREKHGLRIQGEESSQAKKKEEKINSTGVLVS